MTTINLSFTIKCPSCSWLFEVDFLGEVWEDGMWLATCPKCHGMIEAHLTCAVPDVAITCVNCGEYHSIYLPCKGGKQEAATQVS